MKKASLIFLVSIFWALPQSLASGWTPSEEQKKSAVEVAQKFLVAMSNRNVSETYSMFSPGLKSIMSRDYWVSHNKKLDVNIADGLFHDRMKVTWYNNPVHAELPGVYAAFDIICKFKSNKRCTEVLILHQQSSSEFLVMRYELNFF